ncbi:MAG: glycosyltransferase family 4 protein [Candidatus Nanohaloarchaea archaeon]
MLGWGYPPDIDGGLDVHVARLFEELQGMGVDVTLALPEERAPDREGIVGLDAGEGDMMEKTRNLSQEFLELAEEYDIVHTHDWFGSEPGLKAKKYSDALWAATFHSLSSQRNRSPSDRMVEMERGIIERADELIAVSQMLADDIEEKYGREPQVIHNGFSTAESGGRDVKEELGIDGEMVLYVGRHAEQKGLEHLLYGFKKFLQEREATLVLGGDGHMRPALEEFVEILGIEDRVVFEGFIPEEELGDYYGGADVFVSPSINEPFGLTVTEAVEAGTPVVATRSGAEEVLPGNAVVSVEPDSDSIKNGIEEALGREVGNFKSRTWMEVAEEVREVYRNL